ncbi:MAG TPA: protein kinase [Steroidobacteraceae bacterium]|nr:protein kinase [Steroidobacteraceae bacterium]
MNDAVSPATTQWREALGQVDDLLQRTDAERDAALAALKRTQPQLHSLVSNLLRAQAEAQRAGFLEPPSPVETTSPLTEGAMLGPWRIVGQIGEGGMGEVWLARRSDGLYDGEVAIKTLHPWFARSALRERFLREAQLLGRISHPNIARLLDAGVSDGGLMYLVLEYVRGIALDQYCDERRLDIPQRLGLFLATCAAVEHAHSHLIVHRDLKPSNILVTDSGEVKLLDFGVATLLEAESAAARDLTRLTGRVYTPEFAAPEQLRGETITTATDVYSLGVILYVLLTGQRPHMTHASAAALEHAVLHEDAPRPSRALRGALDENVAALRGSTPKRLRRDLAGDLDNIVARALEKRPADRYAGVPALSSDVIRHLRHRPVQARAAGLRYRAAKFLRRNRLPVAIGAMALVATVMGAGVALWQADVARVEARKANAIRDFLVGVFERNSVAHPDGARARKTTAEELLAQSAREIRTGLRDAPEVRHELLGVMSRLYTSLDMQPDAIGLLEEKLAGERVTHGPHSLAVARTLSDLAWSQVQSGAYPAAEKSARESLRLFAALDDRTSLEHGRAYGSLGQIAWRTDTQESGAMRRHYDAALAIIERNHPRSRWRIDMLLGRSRAANLDSNNTLELEYCEQALKLIENGTIQVDGVLHGSVLAAVGSALVWLHRYEEAEIFMRRSITMLDRAGGVDHPAAADGRRELGTMLMWVGRRAEARKVLGEALATHERTKGADDPEMTAYARSDVASNLYLRGELAEAEPHMLRSYANWEAVDKSVMMPRARLNLARLQTQQGRFAEAALQLKDLEPKVIEIFGKGSWMHTTVLARTGEFELARGRLDEARSLFERLCTEYAEAPDAMTTNRAAGHEGLVRVALAEGDLPKARALAIRLIDAVEASKGRAELIDQEAAARMLLGVALLRSGDVAAARPELGRALRMRESMDAPQSLWLAEARLHLADALQASGDASGASRLVALAEAAHRTQGRVGPQFARLRAPGGATLAAAP